MYLNIIWSYNITLQVPNGSVLVLTTFWQHKNDPTFRRKSTEYRTEAGEQPIGLLEYYFEGEPHNVSPKKTKRGKDIIPMCPSAKARVNEILRTNPHKGPKSVMVEAAGECSSKDYCDLPTGVNQV